MAVSQYLPVMLSSDLGDHFPLVAKGKVREIYAIDDSKLLFLTTDRVSAYDVVMKNGIPSKGRILTRLTSFWFTYLSTVIPSLKTHFLSVTLPPPLPSILPASTVSQLRGRCMQVRRLKIFPIEVIVRGYITGSAWAEYQEKGTVHGMAVRGMEAGENGKMKECERFEKPIYTPSTKAEVGEKDENIHPDEAAKVLGKFASRIESLSLEIYAAAHAHALSRGIILADTKFEFGIDPSSTDEDQNDVYLADEVLTPDSSRYWRADTYAPGKPQESYDKQFLRDFLSKNGLKGKEGVEMPEDVVRGTAERYREAYEKIVGKKWEDDGDEDGW